MIKCFFKQKEVVINEDDTGESTYD